MRFVEETKEIGGVLFQEISVKGIYIFLKVKNPFELETS